MSEFQKRAIRNMTTRNITNYLFIYMTRFRLIPDFGVSTAIILSQRYLSQVVQVELRTQTWKR